MGYMRHHAIVVTSWSDDEIVHAHAKAVELGCTCSNITGSAANGYQSFLVAPDGSKEGWPASRSAQQQRDALVAFMDTRMIDWVEVQFADENGENLITRDSSRMPQVEARLTTGDKSRGGREDVADEFMTGVPRDDD